MRLLIFSVIQDTLDHLIHISHGVTNFDSTDQKNCLVLITTRFILLL